MATQLKLFVPPVPPQAPKFSWKQEENRSHVRHGYGDWNKHYHPRRAKEIILRTVGFVEWVGFCKISDATGMAVRLIVRLLDQMVRQGRLEKTELYYVYGGDKSRLVKPCRKDYRGFEHGFRRLR